MNDRANALTLIRILALVGSIGAIAYPRPASSYPLSIALQFPAVPDRGAPATTSGGGTRSDTAFCVNTGADELSLNPLTPYYGKTVTTASANPTLYFYVPPTKAAAGEAVLLDDNDNEILAAQFALPPESGIVRLNLQPKTALVPGRKYRWSVSLVCDPRNRTRDVSIAGIIEYRPLEAPIARSLEVKNFLEKARFYAGRGDWLDTLDNAAKVRGQQLSEWTELLQSVGLDALLDRPIVDCCTLEKAL